MSDDWIVCTGVIDQDENSFNKNHFVIMRMDRDLDIKYFQVYDIIHTTSNPVLVEGKKKTIICSGLKMKLYNGEVGTYLIQFKWNMQIKSGSKYDTTESIHIKALVVRDEYTLAVGAIGITTSESDIKDESSIMIKFDNNVTKIEYHFTDDNVWVDTFDKYTCFNNAIISEHDSIICVGYTVVDDRRYATVWKFTTFGKEPITYVVDLDEDNTLCYS